MPVKKTPKGKPVQPAVEAPVVADVAPAPVEVVASPVTAVPRDVAMRAALFRRIGRDDPRRAVAAPEPAPVVVLPDDGLAIAAAVLTPEFADPCLPSDGGTATALAVTTVGSDGKRHVTTRDGSFVQMAS